MTRRAKLSALLYVVEAFAHCLIAAAVLASCSDFEPVATGARVAPGAPAMR